MNSIQSRVRSFLNNPYRLLLFFKSKGCNFSFIPDEIYLQLYYKATLNKYLNLKVPQTFNEKLQWLKLNDHNPLYTRMVDKYEAKEFVASVIGEQYIIPALGVWDRFEDIDFTKLPNRFVLKCTHDSGGIVICREIRTLNNDLAKQKINKCLKRNYYYSGREWPYKNVKPRILAETYMEDNETDNIAENGFYVSHNELKDYKFFCFNGKVKCFKVDFDRFTEHRANYYDAECNLLPFGEVECPPKPDKEISLPDEIPQMIELAEKLAKDIPFVRIDFYNVNHKIYFGEITFFPASGFGKFVPEEWDAILGSWLELPN